LITQLAQLRQKLYAALPLRRDALMDLIDALASSTTARSVVELSLSEPFRRSYTAVFDAIEHFFHPSSPKTAQEERRRFMGRLLEVVWPFLPPPRRRKFWLFGVDTTPIERLYAPTLKDRSMVYKPTVIRGNKPITLGHQYALLGLLPEKDPQRTDHWMVPLLMDRVATDTHATAVAHQQLALLLGPQGRIDPQQLCVSVGDTAYSAAAYLHDVSAYENLVSIARLRATRTLYHPYPASPPQHRPLPNRRRGHPTWYGDQVAVSDPATWVQPEEHIQCTWTTKKGRHLTVTVSAITPLLMRGKRHQPMHDKPLRLVRIYVTDAQGTAVYKHPLYLIVAGQRRDELTLREIYEAFKQRFDLEHFFRFGKQRLLRDAAQTPIVDHEENWVQLSLLAYQQLFLARFEAQPIKRAYEHKAPPQVAELNGAATPTQTQRDFGRIIRALGTPAQPPKLRNKPFGRLPGLMLQPRQRWDVVKKTKKRLTGSLKV